MLGPKLMGQILEAMRSGKYASVVIAQRQINLDTWDGEIIAAVMEAYQMRLPQVDPRYLKEYKASYNLETVSLDKGEYEAILSAVREASSIVECRVPLSPCACIPGNSDYGAVQDMGAQINLAATANAEKLDLEVLQWYMQKNLHIVVDWNSEFGLVGFGTRGKIIEGKSLEELARSAIVTPVFKPLPASASSSSRQNMFCNGCYN